MHNACYVHAYKKQIRIQTKQRERERVTRLVKFINTKCSAINTNETDDKKTYNPRRLYETKQNPKRKMII